MLFVAVSLSAQVPEKPNPQRLVNDYASVFTASQRAQLENFLVMVDDSTSNQICVVAVNDFGGMDKSQYATELGQKWGVGGKANNGVVVLIKPKVGNGRGEAFIAIGYGLEGAIPDAIANRIVDEIMIPHFKQNDYFGGTSAAVSYIYKIAKGEISVVRTKSNNSWQSYLFIAIVMFFIIITVVSKGKGGGNKDTDDNSHTTYGDGGILPWMLLGGGSGRSSGGYSGGGFGGFGGGSFGGGGAGGSW